MSKKKKDSQSLIAKFFAKKKKPRKSRVKSSWMTALKVVLVIAFLTCLVAAGAVGMIYLDRHTKARAAKERPDGSLKLIARPPWLNQELRDAIVKSAGGERFPLDERSAELVAERLSGFSWLENVRAQTTPEYLEVKADYRRPVGWVQGKRERKVYLDAKMRVLEYLPLTAIAIPEIKGLASIQIPEDGLVWNAEDAKAAIELLDLLNKMDLYFLNKEKIEKPLLSEVESIDVSNFAARKSRSEPAIILNIKDGTMIYWGAAWGQAAVYLEADDKVKLTRLYETFISYDNSLQVQDKVKYIELRWLEDAIPRLK
ncbi:MAG: hypothetical protein LLF76_03715 [Planctomycetaceae bacterium]|nr:hypothetical protein [Planctomycetaceae bacterium]